MKTADIVIIGGGIIGASLAYQIAQRGAKNVVLLERGQPASGSSGRATGGIRQQFADEIDIRFSIEGVRFYEQFTHERDTGIERPAFLQYGYSFLATNQASWQVMQRHVALQQSLGVPTQLLTPHEIQRMIPQLVVDDIVGATFCATDGYSDPAAMALALIHEAQHLGVTICEHTPVTGITVQRNHVEAVRTTEGTIPTQLVINATGPHAASLAHNVGIQNFPVYPLRRQVYLTEPFANLPDRVPMVVDLVTGFHFRRRGSRVVVTMPLPMSEQDDLHNRQLALQAFDLTLNEHFWYTVHAEAKHRCPPLAEAPIERAWVGLYEMTPDEHPILGKTEIDGFLCACGFSGHGFMHAPMAAKLMTELILDGRSSTLPIDLFSLERFHTGKLIHTTHLL